jgi:hypothetical protein
MSHYTNDVAVKAVRRLETESFCSMFVYLKNTSFEAHEQLAKDIAHKKFTFRPQTTNQDADIRLLYPEVRTTKDLPEWVEIWSRKAETNGAAFTVIMSNGQPDTPIDRTLYHDRTKLKINRHVRKREIVAFGLNLLQKPTTTKIDIPTTENIDTLTAEIEDDTQATNKSDEDSDSSIVTVVENSSNNDNIPKSTIPTTLRTNTFFSRLTNAFKKKVYYYYHYHYHFIFIFFLFFFFTSLPV